MLTKLTYGYLILTTAAPIAGILIDYAPVAIVATVVLHWIVIPRILKCARRIGRDEATDEVYCEAIDVYVAELRRCGHSSTPQVQ
jgi:hypothetical protein